MDSSWFHGYATANAASNNGFMCGYAASYTPTELQHKEEEAELLISSQIQHHLNQISMHMIMDDKLAYDGALDIQQQHPTMVDGLLDQHHTSNFPTSSSSFSLSLRSGSLTCSPESSAQILGTPAGATAGGQFPEVSSHVPSQPVVPYINVHVPTPAAPGHHDASVAMAQESPAAGRQTGAFKSFARHLGPRRQPKPGACGQRMFKTAMSVLSKMNAAASARYGQQYYYQQAVAPPPPSVNQLHHKISERKRREKLNDSFQALKTVLPPGAKDKTSILIRAREYIRSLESKASQLGEKNKSLESRRLAHRCSSDAGKRAGADSGEKVQIEITRAAKVEYRAEIEPRDLCTLKIVVRSRCNMTDVALRTLQCLKDQAGDDVNLVSMNTSGGSVGSPQTQTNSSPRAVLTMQIKSSFGAKWEEQPVKDAVAKVVADAALTLPSAETSTSISN